MSLFRGYGHYVLWSNRPREKVRLEPEDVELVGRWLDALVWQIDLDLKDSLLPTLDYETSTLTRRGSNGNWWRRQEVIFCSKDPKPSKSYAQEYVKIAMGLSFDTSDGVRVSYDRAVLTCPPLDKHELESALADIIAAATRWKAGP